MTHQTAFVTGATRGLGRELVRQLQRRQLRVFATGRDAAQLAELQRETGCLGTAGDLADPSVVTALYRQAKEALGEGPGLVINNAGFNSRKALLTETTLEELDAQYAVNLRAPYLICRDALRDMAARGSGHIVNVLSSVVRHGNAQMAVYTAMKHALHGLNTVLVKEAQPRGVKVTAVYPGGIDTTFRSNARPDYMSAESAAQVILDTVFAPADVIVHELTFRPIVETNF
jgi:NAD(P)-dependent dehydrogenase (short-subunit alcohol dehydrogenase family)